jgi:hypothetical protein
MSNSDFYPLMDHIGASPPHITSNLPLFLNIISAFGTIARRFDNRWSLQTVERYTTRIQRAARLVYDALQRYSDMADQIGDRSRVLCAVLCDHDSQHLELTRWIVRDLSQYAIINGRAPLLRLIWDDNRVSPFAHLTGHGILSDVSNHYNSLLGTQQIWIYVSRASHVTFNISNNHNISPSTGTILIIDTKPCSCQPNDCPGTRRYPLSPVVPFTTIDSQLSPIISAMRYLTICVTPNPNIIHPLKYLVHARPKFG